MFKDIDNFMQSYSVRFIEAEGRPVSEGSAREHYATLVRMIKDYIGLNWMEMKKNTPDHNKEKQVYYFSMEFLIGRLLEYHLVNFGVREIVQAGMEKLGISYDGVVAQEKDAGLGNGGLGRLAACFLESMAFLKVHGHGNSIRYKYGFFQQKFINGDQVEVPDNWLRDGYLWEVRKPDQAVIVKFKGHVRTESVNHRWVFTHENYEPVLAVPYDVAIDGFDNDFVVNNLRLWSAEPVANDIDLSTFNSGDFTKAVRYNAEIQAISNILYPDGGSLAGRELRLKQEYFFVAAGLGSIVRMYKKKNKSFRDFPNKLAVHINDTHPSLCIAELMRILMDEEGLGWDAAWNITVNTCSFTNHTIMPEALETWQIDLFRYILPRIYLIIEEIDRRYREEVQRRFPDQKDLADRTAIIHNGIVDTAALSIIGSHSVNGVSDQHSEILKNHTFSDYYKIYPYKFKNVTNGISHRRFLLKANPDLSTLITSAMGDRWKYDANALEGLLQYEQDTEFLDQLAEIKYRNKCRLAEYIQETQKIQIDPRSIFDVQVKRIHAYKRQLMNALKIMDLYNRLKERKDVKIQPVTFIFGGKTAPGYFYAKQVIRMINALSEIVNTDKEVNSLMKVIFLEDFNVSLGELIYPAADISEQISAASREASGTGNMKFMFNGALTLGTMDGANVEICEAVGREHIETFGISADEVLEYYNRGGYDPWEHYHNSPRIKHILDQLINGFFREGDGDFRVIYDSLLRDNDQFFVLKDFRSYVEAWTRLDAKYARKRDWFRSSLVNTAKAGIFSSDRSIRDYAENIWKVKSRELGS
ncbi:MAG: glycogen/starch/alpha-glucan phosphorylase [Peptococcaceae bacterium]|nr:glycogen/starch/alpha-glucan phosphorylase [Peptococcaceae bacterium]